MTYFEQSGARPITRRPASLRTAIDTVLFALSIGLPEPWCSDRSADPKAEFRADEQR